MRSAVRLFCFLIGMVFPQIPPLLLLVNLLFVLLLVRGCALDELERDRGCALDELESVLGVRFGRGNLHRITQSCGNKRFMASDDSRGWLDT